MGPGGTEKKCILINYHINKGGPSYVGGSYSWWGWGVGICPPVPLYNLVYDLHKHHKVSQRTMRAMIAYTMSPPAI